MMNPELSALLEELDDEAIGGEIYRFAEAAWPICRSITGDGVRQTLALISEIVPALEVREVASGTEVFDWHVPDEWNVRDAYIADSSGRRIVDFQRNNLHLLGYSTSVRETLTLDQLRPYLFTDPQRPAAIPYRTSYYQKRWGFCLPHEQLQSLPEDDYEVFIDSTLQPGHLTYGEVALEGECDEVVLISTHVCHPSLCNDNLSSLGVVAHLARLLAELPHRRYSYRFVFIPGTIGAITWLAQEEAVARQVCHGLVAANLGDSGKFHYKRSRRENAVIDRAVVRVLEDAGEPFEVEPFEPFGYDERQYCSPGFNLAVGSLTRTPWGRYPEYHTSDDNLSIIQPRRLGESLRRYLAVLHLLEHDRKYRNLNPNCEPQLGRRGLYSLIGGGEDGREKQLALLWVLNQSDGEHSLLDIAERSGMKFEQILDAARSLIATELLAV